MTVNSDSKTDSGRLIVYQIRVAGHLDFQWADWFECMSITLEENGEMLLTSRRIDQSGLYGLLKKVRNLGLPLISVMRVESS